jgi:hypothetical protein
MTTDHRPPFPGVVAIDNGVGLKDLKEKSPENIECAAVAISLQIGYFQHPVTVWKGAADDIQKPR